MEQRETKTIETPLKHKLVIYTYATGREMRAIEEITLKAIKVDVSPDGTQKMKDFDTTSRLQVEDLMIKQFVVSFDDDTNNILDKVLDLPSGEYDFIVKEIDNAVKKNS